MAPLTRTCPLKSRGHGTRRASVVFERDRDRTLSALTHAPGPISAKYLRDALGINGVRMNRVLANLLNNGAINRYPHPHNNRIEMTYCLSPKFKEWLNSSDPVPAAPEADVNGT
jgi:DNA-binding MarR family transcriptional regulator